MNSQLCFLCNFDKAVVKCLDCKQKICVECNVLKHLNLRPIMESEERDCSSHRYFLLCEECEEQERRLQCEECEEKFCQECCTKIHLKGKRATHSLEVLSECSERGKMLLELIFIDEEAKLLDVLKIVEKYQNLAPHFIQHLRICSLGGEVSFKNQILKEIKLITIESHQEEKFQQLARENRMGNVYCCCGIQENQKLIQGLFKVVEFPQTQKKNFVPAIRKEANVLQRYLQESQDSQQFPSKVDLNFKHQLEHVYCKLNFEDAETERAAQIIQKELGKEANKGHLLLNYDHFISKVNQLFKGSFS